MKLIDKDALVAEIEKRIKSVEKRLKRNNSYSEEGVISWGRDKSLYDSYNQFLSFINTLEVKEVEEYKQPEYSCLKTVYWCGKKPNWNIGDTLAYYEFYSDREGECVFGKVTNVEFDEEQCDWFYTFEDGSVYDEQSLYVLEWFFRLFKRDFVFC